MSHHCCTSSYLAHTQVHFASQVSHLLAPAFAMCVGASGATPAAPAAATYTNWYHLTCSKASWSRAKVFSWESEDACRSALLKHLMESGLHIEHVAEHGEEGIVEE